jgi:hypothetical protein
VRASRLSAVQYSACSSLGKMNGLLAICFCDENCRAVLLECWNVLLLRSCLGAARRTLHCSYRSPS